MNCSICEKAINTKAQIRNEKLVCGSCVLTSTKGKPEKAVPLLDDSFEKSKYAVLTPEERQMKRVKIRSNYARDRVVSMAGGALYLHFDGKGYATCPESKLHLMGPEMAARPGRYFIMMPEPEAPAPMVEAMPEPEPEPAPTVEAMPEPEEVEAEAEPEAKAEAAEAEEPAPPVKEEPEKVPETKITPQKKSSKKKTSKKY